jgi:hypothetical protein
MNDRSIQLHPETQRLVDENSLFREELVRLLTDLDDLVQIVKPNLLAFYQTKIGLWELRTLTAQFEIARLKRKIELVQACLNRGQRPNLAEIEARLELDALAWQMKLKEAQERIQAAESRLQHLLPPADDRELKTLYYALVKKLHPDVNSNLTDNHKRLWQRVQSAYMAGDLTEMRALALLAEKSGGVPPAATSLEKLRMDQKILQKQIEELLRRIETIESQPPFTLREQLEDDAWVTARRAEIDMQIDELQSQRTGLESHLQQLLPGPDYGKWFSQN